ncbi:hypothetical protein V2J09_008408 [Rumex salicifolius]
MTEYQTTERQRFARAYLSSSGEEPSESEVAELVESAERYSLANHLFWGLWGLISAYVNKIEFDYKEYARQRFQQYWLKKPIILGISDAPLVSEDDETGTSICTLDNPRFPTRLT